MTVLSPTAIGSRYPRLKHAEPYAESLWAKVESFAKTQLKLTPDLWQEDILRDSLGIDADKHFVTPNVLLLLPRQNGKNHILAIRQLLGLFLLREQAVHTAHELRTSKKQYKLVRGLLKDAGLESRMTYKENNQEICIVNPDNNARIDFISRTNEGGRGLSNIDVIYLDEALKLEEEQLAALLPIQSARSMSGHVQTWYTSSAGKLSSEVLAEVRNTCLTSPKGWTYFEWSAEASADINSPEEWAKANPALGVRLSYDYVLGELQKMPNKFGRERLGIWDESKAESVIAPALWDDGNISDDEVPDNDEIILGVEVAQDQRTVTVALATDHDAGSYVQVLAQAEGFEWVAEFIKSVKLARNVKAIVVDSSGPVMGLVPVLQLEGIKLTMMSTADVKTGCASFLAAVHQKTLKHTADEATKLTVTSAGKRPIGEAWAWKRTGPYEVSPLQAMTYALHGLTNRQITKAKIGRRTAKVFNFAP